MSESAETRRPTLLQRVEYFGFCVLMATVAPFSWRPRAAIAGWLGRNIGARLWLTARAEDNMKARRPTMSATERRVAITAMLDNFLRTASEYTTLPELYAGAPGFEVEGAEHLEAARSAAAGRMVVVSAHFGNWEGVRAAARHRGAPLALVYRAFNNPLIERRWHNYITSVKLPAFHKGATGARAMLRHVLKEGGVMILVDQRLGGAPLLDFLGAPAETSLAPAQLALRAQVPLLTAAAFRTPEGFRVRFEPLIEPAAPEVMMKEVNTRMGAWIDEAPEQWFWLHRRWRVRERRRGVRKRSASALSE